MTTVKLSISTTDSAAADVPCLDPCTGVRDWWGGPAACPPGCVAHFDGWADGSAYFRRTGNAYSAYPNSVLSWVSRFPGASVDLEWTNRRHPCFDRSAPVVVRVYRIVDLFCDEGERSVPVRVVIVDDANDAMHYASLFTDADAAIAYATAEINEREADCICDFIEL